MISRDRFIWLERTLSQTHSIAIPGSKFNVHLRAGTYPNERLAIYGIVVSKVAGIPADGEGEMYGKLTTNLPNEVLADDEIHIHSWEENGFTGAVLQKLPHLFEDTGRKVKTGFVYAAVWRIKFP